jgi:hypothetical protein
MVDEVAQGQVFQPVLRLSPVSNIPPSFHIHYFIRLSRTVSNRATDNGVGKHAYIKAQKTSVKIRTRDLTATSKTTHLTVVGLPQNAVCPTLRASYLSGFNT